MRARNRKTNNRPDSKELTSREKTEIAIELGRRHKLPLVLEILGLARSTFYYNRSHPKADRYEDVRPLVKEVYGRTRNGVGHRQVHMALRNEQGLCIAPKTVLKIMREMGLRTRIRRPKLHNPTKHKDLFPCEIPNVLNRDFDADGPCEKLATDFTQFWVAGEWCFFSPVLDLYNNEVLCWETSHGATSKTTVDMVTQLGGIMPDGATPILHSDGGFPYKSAMYRSKLGELGIVQSMSRPGTPRDNACVESFFGHLKDELYRWQEFDDYDAFVAELGDYVSYWNTGRYQAGLEGMTPVQYRLAKAELAQKNGNARPARSPRGRPSR